MKVLFLSIFVCIGTFLYELWTISQLANDEFGTSNCPGQFVIFMALVVLNCLLKCCPRYGLDDITLMPANLEEMVGAAFDCDYDDELQELDITYEDNVAFREQLELEYQVDNSDDEDIDEGIYDDQDIVDDDEMVLPFRPIEDRVLGHIPRHAEETW